ncbi:response regulator [Alteromonas sp. 345S023]|uniref:histidine kinase n=1 Tax=Alteromonas profundi TaxID=2696062 RepID=A0A7X5RLZ2_9ALTE|nr:response regulator [Alteromonas profundi]NDV92417.1 response regulator [Alteromonas profundi]
MDITKEPILKLRANVVIFGAIFIFFVQNANAVGVALDGRNKFAGIPTGIIYDVEVVGSVIYVASENGVFEVIGGRSTKLNFNPNSDISGPISDIQYDPSGHLWIVEYGVGVFKVRIADKSSVELPIPKHWKEYVWSVAVSPSHLALSIVSGVYIVDKSTGLVEAWADSIGLGNTTSAYSIATDNQNFYVASETELLTIDPEHQTIKKDTLIGRYNELSTLNVVEIHEDSVYLAGKEGIYIVNQTSSDFFPFFKAHNKSDNVTDLHISDNGEIWVAAGGMYKVSNGLVSPAKFLNPVIYSESIRSITAIAETNSNDLLIASSQLGLIGISKKHRAVNFLHENGDILDKKIVTHGVDRHYALEIRTKEKSYTVDLTTGALTSYGDSLGAECIERNAVIFTNIKESDASNFKGCGETYFHTIEISKDSFYAYHDNGSSSSYYLVHEGVVVDEISAPAKILHSVLSESGELLAYDSESNIHIQLSKLSWRKINVQEGGWSSITCLIELSDVFLICTTGKGLVELSKETGRIARSKILETKEIRFIRGAILSENNNLWVTTNMGLFLYDFQEGVTHYIGIEDGILDTDFEYNSFIGNSGSIIVFGDRYPYLINEKLILDAVRHAETNGPSSVYTMIAWGAGIEKKEVHYPSAEEFEFQIGSDYDSIAINIGTNSFLAHENQHVEFRIVGLNNDWVVHPESFVYVALSDLSYGRYQVESRILEDGRRSSVSRLNFIVIPPFYLSYFAFIIYFISAVAFIVLAKLGYLKPFKRYLKNTKVYQFIARYELTDGQSKFEKTLRAKEKHISNIAHDLRTPLQIILGSLEKAPDSTNISSTEFTTLRQNAMRIEKLVDQMSSTVPNIEGSKSLFSRYSVEDVSHVVMNVEPLAKAKNQHLEVTCRGKQHICLISDSLEKIVTNLVENAIKYTPEHGNIKVCASIDDKNLRVTVTDDGEGIDASDHDKVLERFVRVHKGEVEGQGVGLSLVDDLVKLNQGKLTLSSVLGQGAKWTVILPLDDTESVNAEQSSNTEGKNWDDRHTIIVIDDNREFRTYMFNLLTKNYRCLIAKSGRQALELMGKYKVDLVITDLMMRGIDGITLTENIRSHETFATTPVIILTAKTDEATKRKALEEKADYYLTKPTPNNELLLLVDHLLSLRTLTAVEGAAQPILPQLGESLRIPEFTSEKDMNFYLNFIEVLEKNYHNEHFNRDMAANLLLMSARSLNRRLSELFDYNFSEFLTRFRIDKAVPLLVNGGSVITTGMDVGFGTPSYFSTSFKKIKGVSPKKFVDERKVGEG